MRNFASVLVVVASLCLLITLVLAWCLVGVRSSAFMKRLFPNYQYLLKAHIDYLLMTGLLMIFFLLFDHFQVSPPPVVASQQVVAPPKQEPSPAAAAAGCTSITPRPSPARRQPPAPGRTPGRARR